MDSTPQHPSASRPKGNRRSLQRAATRQALIDAACQRFIRYGYNATRIEDIARDAGASAATFYLHFPTKRDLASELVTIVRDDGIARYELLSDMASHANARTVDDWLRGTLERWADMAPLVQVIEQVAAIDPVINDQYQDIFDDGKSRVAKGLELSGVPRPDAERRALLVISLHHGLFRHFQRDSSMNLDAVRPVVRDMWLVALAGGAH
ncbi:TetR/AcrR family transcriptional regulator [Pseudoclavibacter terrae]|nr:TetR/AcrR family transcriptional regulator [Pseudoclavibacter terrae]